MWIVEFCVHKKYIEFGESFVGRNAGWMFVPTLVNLTHVFIDVFVTDDSIAFNAIHSLSRLHA